jgi:hypothetical protein
MLAANSSLMKNRLSAQSASPSLSIDKRPAAVPFSGLGNRSPNCLVVPEPGSSPVVSPPFSSRTYRVSRGLSISLAPLSSNAIRCTRVGKSLNLPSSGTLKPRSPSVTNTPEYPRAVARHDPGSSAIAESEPSVSPIASRVAAGRRPSAINR